MCCVIKNADEPAAGRFKKLHRMRETYLNISDKLSLCRSRGGAEASRYKRRSSRLLRATQRNIRNVSLLYSALKKGHIVFPSSDQGITTVFTDTQLGAWYHCHSNSATSWSLLGRCSPWLSGQHLLLESGLRGKMKEKKVELREVLDPCSLQRWCWTGYQSSKVPQHARGRR